MGSPAVSLRASVICGADLRLVPPLRPAQRPVREAPAPAPERPQRRSPGGGVVQLKVSLRRGKPPIWRRLEIRETTTLDELHLVIQRAFDWQNYHLHVFEVDGHCFGEPDPELGFVSEYGVRLTRLVGVGERLTYTYDFGDDWEHVIEVERMLPITLGVRYPRCTAGRRASPPEDCGGIWAYHDLIASRSLDFDPAAFDLEEINRRLVP